MKDTSSLAQTSGRQRGESRDQTQDGEKLQDAISEDEDTMDSDGLKDQTKSDSEGEDNNMDLDVGAVEEITEVDEDEDEDSVDEEKETITRASTRIATRCVTHIDSSDMDFESDSSADDDDENEEYSSSDRDRDLTVTRSGGQVRPPSMQRQSMQGASKERRLKRRKGKSIRATDGQQPQKS